MDEDMGRRAEGERMNAIELNVKKRTDSDGAISVKLEWRAKNVSQDELERIVTMLFGEKVIE